MDTQKASSRFNDILQHKRHKKVQISITIDEDILSEITKITEGTRLSRAEVINNLLRNDLFDTNN